MISVSVIGPSRSASRVGTRIGGWDSFAMWLRQYVLHAWQDESLDKRQDKRQQTLDLSSWPDIVWKSKTPKQTNGYDCAAYTFVSIKFGT